jgi:hypothetical protein
MGIFLPYGEFRQEFVDLLRRQAMCEALFGAQW